MSGRKGTKQMSQADFNKVKDLLAINVPIKYIIGITSRSHGTISLIRKSDDFQSYKENVTALHNKPKQVEPVTPAVESDVSENNDLQKLLETILEWHSETNSLLSAVSKKIDFIESNMLIDTHKKGLFR